MTNKEAIKYLIAPFATSTKSYNEYLKQNYCTGFVTELDEEVNEMGVECEDEAYHTPTFNRKELKEALDYWYEHFEVNNEEQNRAVWCAINTIKYCIEHDSGYQEGEENEDSQL